MSEKLPLHPADVHGAGRLAADATVGLADLVEAVHTAILAAPGLRHLPASAAIGGLAGLVYGGVRGFARTLGAGADLLLSHHPPRHGQPHESPEREAMLAAMNGVLGDYLAASDNPLRIAMHLRQAGEPLDSYAPAPAMGPAGGKILLLVHGLCMNDLQWQRQGHDHGARLAAELGFTPIYLHYNSGLHISTNGRALADLLESTLRCWPVPIEQLAIVAHSMGGLVARSACHYGAEAGNSWLGQLRALVFLGTPHHGAPLERVGSWAHAMLGASPYTAAFARLGRLRSAGITDLRYGSLLDADWAGRDRFAHSGAPHQHVPLPAGVRCYTIAASTGKAGRQLLGDGLVPLASALGDHADPELALAIPADRRWLGQNINHLELLSNPEVYERLRGWLAT